MRDRPYFMSDDKWYRFDFYKRMYVLTEFAPKEAKKSYDEYIKNLRSKQRTL